VKGIWAVPNRRGELQYQKTVFVPFAASFRTNHGADLKSPIGKLHAPCSSYWIRYTPWTVTSQPILSFVLLRSDRGSFGVRVFFSCCLKSLRQELLESLGLAFGFRFHLSPVAALCASCCGIYCARTAKCYTQSRPIPHYQKTNGISLQVFVRYSEYS
jgi:hypothetical protein